MDKKKKTAVIAIDVYVYKSSQKMKLPMKEIQGNFFFGHSYIFCHPFVVKMSRFFIFLVNFYWPINDESI